MDSRLIEGNMEMLPLMADGNYRVLKQECLVSDDIMRSVGLRGGNIHHWCEAERIYKENFLKWLMSSNQEDVTRS